MRDESPQDESPQEREQAELAAQEAAAIGGGDPRGVAEQAGNAEHEGETDPALRPVYEAGGGESEGFEQSEELLIEHASHGDQQPAHAVLHDQGPGEEAIPGSAEGEPDREQSSEREDEESPSEQ